ncbi:N-acetylglucosamine kinase [Oceanobacillus salinisoli]|uniref:N-acetylglucosamine kinase n=1 Tax=Oceanobacillus salinisoli TaxID=2678611 RepID=UPI0012E1C19B|nr:BadF/BadG/BcrA/BcrD ATPase family protein [Oceanobacillus salinisoli]
MEYLLGIDGGGTKTRAAIADGNGIVIAEATAGPSNLHSASKQQVERTFQELFDVLGKSCKPNKLEISYVFAGIAGTASEKNNQIISQILKRLLPGKALIQVLPDPINALYSGTYGNPGIVQISGTGSITYGINRHLKHDRVGGWGYLLGDEGSGYDVGRQGAVAALKAYDGRGIDTMMLSMFLDHFRVNHPQDFIQKIYSSISPKNELADLTKLVFRAYKKKDRAAESIITRAVDEMMLGITTLYNKLFDEEEDAEVVLCGGIFTEKDILPKLLQTRFIDTKLVLKLPSMDPAGGALIGAYLLKEKHVSKRFIRNISNYLK